MQKQWKTLRASQATLPGDEPPAKEPEDSGYETGCSWIFDSCRLSKFDFGYVYFQAVTLK